MSEAKEANPLLDLAKEAMYRLDPDSVRAEVVGEGMYRIRHGDADLVVGTRNGHAAAGIVREPSQFATVIVTITEALNKAKPPESSTP